MEKILQYVWKHKIFPLTELKTQDGKLVEVLNPGVLNTEAGPDFICAKVKIDGLLWAGNVEIHLRTSDWFRHGHDHNKVYDSIILHVASEVDGTLEYPSGEDIPQIQLEIPSFILENYDKLSNRDVYPPCREVIPSISRFVIHSWMTTLLIERLEQRVNHIMQLRERMDMNWEDALFVTVARSFGFGKNGESFEMWANSMSMSALGKHRDSLFQITALFLGQAGMLDGNGISGMADDEYAKLCNEYKFLRTKFSLTPIDRSIWVYLRLRPQNFPHVRIMQLAKLYYEGGLRFSTLLNASTKDEYMKLFDVASHSFKLSPSSKELLLVNSVAPILFAYGIYRNDDALKEKAMKMLEYLHPEDNRVVRDWYDAGVEAEHSADSQALIQLNQAYCLKHDCLRCRFGHEYISRNPDWLKEE